MGMKESNVGELKIISNPYKGINIG